MVLSRLREIAALSFAAAPGLGAVGASVRAFGAGGGAAS